MKKTTISVRMRSSVSSMMMMRTARLRSRGNKEVRTRNDEGDMVQGINGKPAKGERKDSQKKGGYTNLHIVVN